MKPGDQLGPIKMGHDGSLFLPPGYAFFICKCHSSIWIPVVKKPDATIDKLVCATCGNTVAVDMKPGAVNGG